MLDLFSGFTTQGGGGAGEAIPICFIEKRVLNMAPIPNIEDLVITMITIAKEDTMNPRFLADLNLSNGRR